MQKSFKKAIATFLVVLMLMTSVPLNGFVGMDWSFLVSAAEENVISSLDDIMNKENEKDLSDFQNKFEEDKADFSEFAEKVKDEAENVFSLLAEKKAEQAPSASLFSLRSVVPVSEETDFSWDYDEETHALTVRGTGDMPDYTEMLEQEGVPTPIAPWAEYAKEIEKVVIEAGITSVGDCAFALCTNLKEVVLPEGITSIGAGAFAYCVELVDINLPSTLISVDQMAFGMCWSVKELVLPDSIETVGDMAFMYMFDLEKINLPASLQDNGEGMFTYALSLKELVVPEGLKIEAVYDIAEFLTLSLEHITNYSATFAVDLSFEDLLGGYFDSLEYAEAFAYLYKNYFKYEFTGEEAAMLGIEISEQELIEDTINYFNTNLGTDYAVADFENFEHILAVSEELLLSNLIQTYGYPPYFTVSCIENSKQHKLCRDNAISHDIIGEEENCVCFVMNGTIGDNITWSVDAETKTLTFDGLGEMADFNDVPDYVKYSAYIENISFAEGSDITSIGDYAFYGLKNLETISLPEGITTLGEYCFYNSGVKILNLPASLNSTDTLSFYTGTTPLEEINVSEGNESFLSYEGSLYSEYVEYEGEMTYILLKQPEKHAGEFVDNTIGFFYCAFENYSTVTEITVPDTVLIITEGAFLTCSALKTINIGNSKIYEADGETASLEIEDDFVAYCNNLTAINVDERNVNYTSVDGVLYNKAVSELITVPNGIVEVVVPETVTNMRRYALDYDKLQKVTFLNPSCEIREESSAINREATICGYKDSTAEAYADAFSRKFEYIGDITITDVDFDFTDAKKEYSQFDSLDTTGIKVTINFSDGTSSIKTSGFQVTGFNSDKTGEKVLTVTYRSYSETYSVTVTEPFFPAQGGYKYFYIDPGETLFVGFTPEETKSLSLNMSGYDSDTEYYVTVYEEDKQTVIYNGVLDSGNPVPFYAYEAGKTYYFAFSHNRTDYDHYLSVELVQSHDYYVSSSEDATCTESGYITYTCRTCGDSYTEYIYELGHNMVETVVSSATCTSDGEGIAECSRCDYSYDLTYTRLGHKDENSDEICDTCSEEIINISVGETKNIQVSQGEYVYIRFIPIASGRYKFYSISSDDTYGYLYDANMNRLYSNDDDGEDYNFSITYEFEAEETYWWGVRYYDSDYSGSFDVTLECGHSGEWETVTESTCTSVGSKTCVCVQCGKTVTEEIPTLSHNYELTETVPATCTEYGYERYDCTGCDNYYTDDIYPLGHDYIYTTTKEATCTETGVESVTCGRCDYTDENTIAKTMHTDDNSDAVCDVCEAEILYISIDETKSIMVNEGETVYIKFVPAEAGRYSFYSDAYEDTYGYLYDSNMNLLSSDDDDGEELNFLITYDFEAGKVYYFGARYYSSSDSGSFDVTLECAHDGDWEIVTEATCTTAGLESCVCNLCGKTVTKEIPKLSHNYELTETVPATCTEDGYERYDCTGCDEYYTNTLYSSGHDYIYTVIKEATCAEAGKQTVTCSKCDYSEENEIAKIRCTDVDNDYICDICGNEIPYITVGETKTVELGEGETVYIKYIPTVSGAYKFYSTASNDTYGYLYDADMNQITYNDDGGESTNFLITYDFESGKVYYFGVRYYSSSDSGSFDITLQCAHNGEWETVTEATCEIAGSKTCVCIQCGETVTAEIPKLEHEYEKTIVDATCREDMKNVYTCVNCGYYYESFSGDSATGIHIDENLDNICDMCSASFVCGENLVWSLYESGTLTISGSGEMYDYTYPYGYPYIGAPWFADSSFINRIVLSEEVTTVGDYAFLGLWNATEIDWSNNITSIGEGAFRSCSGLSDIIIPYSVTEIKAEAFEYCRGLTSVTIPNSVKTIDYMAFYDCDSLKKIIINSFDCEIYDSADTIYSGAVIYGHENSTAQAYAEKYGRSFVATPCEAVYVEAKNATCIDKGNIEHYYCSVCGLYYSDENCTTRIDEEDVFIDELGHTVGELIEEVLPTCTEEGYTKGACSVCGEEFENSVAALGHTYSDEWETAQELTCVTDGIKVKTCTVCGEKSGLVGIIAEDFPKCIGTDYTHYMDTTFDSYSIPDASRIVLHFSADSYLESGYDYIYVYAGDSAVEENLVGRYTGSLADTIVNVNASSFTIRMTTDQSVTEYGFEISSIDYYNSDNVEITPAPGHNYGDWETVTEATCTTSGAKERVCAACNDKQTETISSFGHSYGEWITKSEATCENNGMQEKTCSTCGNVSTNTIPALGHSYSLVDTVDSTCTESGTDKYICERCEKEYTKTFSPRHRDTDDDGFCDFCNEPYVGVLDLVFVIDSTGSMGDEVSVVKNSIQNYANQLAESNIPYYISLIDFSNDGSNNGKFNYYHINFDFTNDNSEILSGISGLSLKGGSDEPAYSALINGLDELHWGDDSVKRVILIGDETPWDEPSSTTGFDYDDALNSLTEREIVLYSVATGGTDISIFESLATATNGSYYRSSTSSDFSQVLTDIIDSIPESLHIHTYEESYTDATCTNGGITTYHCTGCGKDISTETEPLGHDFSEEWTVDTEPTCTENGSKSHHCSRCDEKSDITEIEATGHNYESVVTEPTCTEKGYTTHTCSVCGSGYTDSIVNELGHSYGDWNETKAPICTETGLEERVCSRCSDVDEQIVDALGHDYSEEWTIDKEATCTEDGSKSHHCTRCDDKADITVIEAHGHDYESVITEPTCTEDGYTTHTCSVCEDTYTDTVVDALGHAYSDWSVTTQPTCTKTGVEKHTCSRCGNVESQTVEALGHDYSEEWTIDKEATCTEDGSKSHHCTRCDDKADVTVIEAHGHDYESVITEPTCTEDGYTTHTCSICEDTYTDTVVDALGHAYSEWTVTTEPTCTKTGVEERTCSRCGKVESQTVDALGHDYSEEWTIDKEATCTEEGSKSHHCSRCDDKADVTVIEKLGHAYNEWKVTTEPTCIKTGVKERICSRCGNVEEQIIDALGHDYSEEWTVDEEATCTEDGSKSHHCTRCDEKADITVIKAAGHSYESVITNPSCTEKGYTTHTCSVCGSGYTDSFVEVTGHSTTVWTVVKEATCTKDGKEESVCDTCGTIVTRTKEKLGHNYGEWTTEKEATVLAEGVKVRACDKCGNREEETIEKIYINIEENTEYGLANFTVVNAQTLEPIEGASIFISTENDGENTFFTDAEGKVSIILPVGKQTISAYAKDCLTRNLTVNVKSGENDIPKIGLSSKNTYDVELTHERMTYEEIVEAGIDVNDPDNQHMYKYELRLEFVPEIDWISFFYYMNGAGQIVGGGSGGGGAGGGGAGGGGAGRWVSGSGSGGFGGGYYYRPATDTEESITVYPVSEYFYLIIRGEVKWLKEMFDVEMLVINNSMTDTLENLSATLTLPDGLSLADMVEGEQTLTQEIENIAEGESKSVHWYVRGDKAGSYSIEALLEGMVMPFEEEIHDVFIADKKLQVWAGDALHLHFEFPNAAYYGEDYPVTITLTNVSDITLYNVTHRITYIEQGRVTYYSDGSVDKEVYMAESDASWYKFVPEFKPGDKIVIELGINIMFESKLIEYQIEQMIKQVDAAEQFINGFKAVMAGLNAANTLVNVITGCSVAIGSFLGADDYASIAGNKANLFKALHSKISSLDKYMTSGNKTFDAAAKLANTGLSATLNAITEDPETWLRNSSYNDVKKVLEDVEALEKSLIPQATAEEVANFNIFDSIRTLISALPVKFTLVRVLYNDDYEENTTTIPWSYSVTSAGPQYFGVSNMSSYLNNLGKAVMAEIYEEAVPSYVQLIPGLDDPLNYDDVKREIIAVEHEIEQFKAKDATGKITFKAYYVENQKSRFRTLARSEGYTLECDNETAVYEDGILTFTGDGVISLTPANTNGGTLYIEDSEGNTYTYDITVVEQHECKANEEQRVIISPTAEYDGFAVKCCETCEDVLEIVNLSVSDCEEHSFGAWTTESEANCTVGGVATRTCSSCGYEETSFIDATGHTEKTINKVDATCTENGYTGDIVCEVCEETISVGEAVEANGHSYEAVITAPTCTADGYTTNTCSVCQDSYISDVTEKLGHTGGTANCEDKAICTVCGEAYGEINPDNHKNVVTDKAVSATCTSTGLTEGIHCDTCGKVIVAQTTTEKLSHTEEIIPAVNSTCTKTGFTEGKKCSVCGEILVKQTETSKLEHSYKSVVTAPTCTNGGYTTYTCSVCKHAYKANETAKLGHNMGSFIVVEQPSCTENGLEIAECSRCDYSEVNELSATGHNYQDGVCTECGDSKSNNCSCNCHKTGFMGFIWKILRFFYKLFGMNKVCSCGVAHY